MGAPPLNLRAMVFAQDEEWVAHCLDLDLVETGATVDAAIASLVGAVQTQLWYARTHDNFAFLFQPAPLKTWQQFGEILKGPHRTVVRVLDDRDQEFVLQSLLAA